MKYNLLLVEIGYGDKIPTYFHRMNVITGDYLTPFVTNKTWEEQVDELCRVILMDRPDKIIFDKFGRGFAFYEIFIRTVDNHYFDDFQVDSFGTITYL